MAGFGRELLRSLQGTRVVPRLVADRPEEWRLGPLTVVVDRRHARLRYARLLVARAAPDAGEVTGAWRRALGRLEARSLAPDVLLPRLSQAYTAVLSRRGRRPGDRVALVEVRDEVCRAAGVTRAQFVWDVARLRRERRLSHAGRRLDLGVATGGTAARRSLVVWIEDDGGGGQYYESFRLVEEARA